MSGGWQTIENSHLLKGPCVRCGSDTLAVAEHTDKARCTACRTTAAHQGRSDSMTNAFSAPSTPVPDPVPFTRDRYGRYELRDPDTGAVKAWTRWTTIASTLDDTYNLQLWKMRMVARGMGLRPALVAGSASVADANTDYGKQTLNRIADEALTAAGGTDGRELGSALHGFTETWDRAAGAGAHPEAAIGHIPERFVTDVLAYDMAMKAHGLEVVDIERVCITPSCGAAGTYDRIVRCPDGKLRILDLKTQKDFYSWLSIATQLAGYAHATHHLVMSGPETGSWEPMPQVDREKAIVMHVRPGSGVATPYLVDIDRGWGLALTACAVRDERKAAKNWGLPMEPPTVTAAVASAGSAMRSAIDQMVTSGEATPHLVDAVEDALNTLETAAFCTDAGHAWNCPGPHAPGKMTIRDIIVHRIEGLRDTPDARPLLNELWAEFNRQGHWDSGLTELGMKVLGDA